MKKTISIALLFLSLLIGGHLCAQSSFEFGIRFNPEFTTLKNKNDKDADGQLDYAKHFGYLSFGAGGVYSFNNHIGVALDLLFSREGQAFTGNIGNNVDSNAYSSVVVLQSLLAGDSIGGPYEALAELNFIKLPLMLSLTTDRTKTIYFNCLVGPQINFLQGVAQEVNGEDLAYPGTDVEPKDLYKPVTFDGVLALGVGCNVTSHFALTAHLRFDYGFSDVEKKDVQVSYMSLPPVNFYTTTRSSTHNATTALMIGINYKL